MTQFCIECGAPLRLNSKFCTKCGATASVNSTALNGQADAEGSGSSSFFERYMSQIIFGAAALAIAVVVGIFFFANPKSEVDLCDPLSAARDSACDAVAEPTITGLQTNMFIVAGANVRDRATSKGSNIIDKFNRGQSVSGVMQIGEDGESRWFKLVGNPGFIGAVNLSGVAPPKLAKTFADMKWNVEVGTDLLASPADGSAVVAHLNARDQTTIAGVTENGFAEVKLTKGGVGYFLATAANDRTGALMLSSAPYESDMGEDSPTADANLAEEEARSASRMEWEASAEGRAAAANGNATFQEPADYCRAVNNVDTPKSPYRGPNVPRSLTRAIHSKVDNWRCMDGRVWTCFGGASGGACAKMNPSRVPSNEIRVFCGENPNSDFIPMSVIGNSASTWRCDGKRATIVETFPLDKRNFMVESWRAVN